MAHLEEQRLLLDTHVLLWLLAGSPRLGGSARLAEIERAAEREALFASAISAWEIASMEQAGVLRLATPAGDWLQQAAESPGLDMIAADRAICYAAATLPGRFNGDYADRCIVATARVHNCLLITADPSIRTYAAGGYVRAAGLEE